MKTHNKNATGKCWKSLMESTTQRFDKEWNEGLFPKSSEQKSVSEVKKRQLDLD